jgi:hypothetical protein
MPNTANPLRLINEFIVMLLGALLILLAVSRGVGLPSRPGALIALGLAIIYWGVRAGMRRGGEASGSLVRVRSSSLIVVGLLVLSIPLLPLRYAAMLLGLAGCVLVLRGILGAALSMKKY